MSYLSRNRGCFIGISKGILLLLLPNRFDSGDNSEFDIHDEDDLTNDEMDMLPSSNLPNGGDEDSPHQIFKATMRKFEVTKDVEFRTLARYRQRVGLATTIEDGSAGLGR